MDTHKTKWSLSVTLLSAAAGDIKIGKPEPIVKPDQ